MPTITPATPGPGAGAIRPVMSRGPRMLKQAVYSVDFDSSYPTGGEDISSCWDGFQEVVGIFVQPHDTTIADNRNFIPDLTNKKLILLTAINTEGTAASNQAAVGSVKLLVVGY